MRPLHLGHQADGEEQGRTLLHGGWVCMGTEGFLGQFSRETDSQISQGRARSCSLWSSRSVVFFAHHSGCGGGGCEPLGSASAGKDKLEWIYLRPKGPAAQI